MIFMNISLIFNAIPASFCEFLCFKPATLHQPASKGVGGRSASTIDPWADIFHQKSAGRVGVTSGAPILWTSGSNFSAQKNLTLGAQNSIVHDFDIFLMDSNCSLNDFEAFLDHFSENLCINLVSILICSIGPFWHLKQ